MNKAKQALALLAAGAIFAACVPGSIPVSTIKQYEHFGRTEWSLSKGKPSELFWQGYVAALVDIQLKK